MFVLLRLFLVVAMLVSLSSVLTATYIYNKVVSIRAQEMMPPPSGSTSFMPPPSGSTSFTPPPSGTSGTFTPPPGDTNSFGNFNATGMPPPTGTQPPPTGTTGTQPPPMDQHLQQDQNMQPGTQQQPVGTPPPCAPGQMPTPTQPCLIQPGTQQQPNQQFNQQPGVDQFGRMTEDQERQGCIAAGGQWQGKDVQPPCLIQGQSTASDQLKNQQQKTTQPFQFPGQGATDRQFPGQGATDGQFPGMTGAQPGQPDQFGKPGMTGKDGQMRSPFMPPQMGTPFQGNPFMMQEGQFGQQQGQQFDQQGQQFDQQPGQFKQQQFDPRALFWKAPPQSAIQKQGKELDQEAMQKQWEEQQKKAEEQFKAAQKKQFERIQKEMTRNILPPLERVEKELAKLTNAGTTLSDDLQTAADTIPEIRSLLDEVKSCETMEDCDALQELPELMQQVMSPDIQQQIQRLKEGPRLIAQALREFRGLESMGKRVTKMIKKIKDTDKRAELNDELNTAVQKVKDLMKEVQALAKTDIDEAFDKVEELREAAQDIFELEAKVRAFTERAKIVKEMIARAKQAETTVKRWEKLALRGAFDGDPEALTEASQLVQTLNAGLKVVEKEKDAETAAAGVEQAEGLFAQLDDAMELAGEKNIGNSFDLFRTLPQPVSNETPAL